MSTPHALVPARRTARQREERRFGSWGWCGRDFPMRRSRATSVFRASGSGKSSRSPSRQTTWRTESVRRGCRWPGWSRRCRLAARGVDNGKLSAINPLLRILDKLDKYGAVAEPAHPYWEGAHEQLIAKSAPPPRGAASGCSSESAATGRPDTPTAPRGAPAALKNLKPDLGWRKS